MDAVFSAEGIWGPLGRGVAVLVVAIVGFMRYSRDDAFSVISRHKAFVIVMALGSVAGTFIGGHLLGIVPDHVLLPALSLILLISAVKVWKHG